MPISLLNPAGLPESPAYHQVSVATGSRFVFVAGQVAVDAQGAPVGAGDLAAQAEQCYRNVATALAGAGAGFDDVARLTVYAVDWTPDKMPQFMTGVMRAAAALGITALPPASLIGVSMLASPEFLLEIEATAVLA